MKMNNRKLKKNNKKKHLNIVSQLPFTLTNHTFGSGYFVFDLGPNAVSWFWLKELPDWKFGIWLDKNSSFEIFGQSIAMIDKFKPYSSPLSYKDDLAGFVGEICKIIDHHPDWKEYLDNAEEAAIYEKRKQKFEQEVYQKLFDTCKSLCTDSYNVQIKDRNTKTLHISPRYQVVEAVDIIEGVDQSDNLTNEELIESINSFEVLCRSLSEVCENNAADFAYRESYIFTTLGQPIVSPEKYNRDAITYKSTVETFDDYLKEFFDEQQEWKIDEKQLKYILRHWKKDNYPDTPTVPGFTEALERCYDGQYNPWVAKKLINEMFDYGISNWLND